MNPMALTRTQATLPSRVVRTTLLLLGVLGLTGCANQGAVKETPEPQASAATAAPAQIDATPPPTAIGESGTVVFFRDKKFIGSAIGFKVREAEQELGKLANGTYFTAVVPVGPHAFDVYSEAKDVLNLEVEKGETYYIQGSLAFGVLVGRPNLAPSDAATFAALKDKLKDSGAEAAAKAAKKAARASNRKGSR
jgi:hypothetical protein